MTELDIGTALIRLLNLVFWVVLSVRILISDRPVSGMARNVILMVIVFGMGVLFTGSLIPFGVVDGPTAKILYTAFTAFAGIVAISLISTGEPNGHLPGDGDPDDPGRSGGEPGE